MDPIRPVPQCAYDFLTGAEADKLVAYRDSKGKWTIGRGHTGPEVVEGFTITEAQSLAYLIQDVAIAAGRLAKVVKATVIASLSEHQYAALISFVFNLGEDASWTIWKLLNSGDLAGVPDQMKRFDKETLPDGKVKTVPGLDNRRLAEITLWNTADVPAAVAIVQAAPVTAPPSSETRAAATPPTPPVVKPLAKSKSFMASCATAVAGVAACAAPALQSAGVGVQSVRDALTPYVGADSHIVQVQHAMTLILAGCAAATALLLILKHNDDKAA